MWVQKSPFKPIDSCHLLHYVQQLHISADLRETADIGANFMCVYDLRVIHIEQISAFVWTFKSCFGLKNRQKKCSWFSVLTHIYCNFLQPSKSPARPNHNLGQWQYLGSVGCPITTVLFITPLPKITANSFKSSENQCVRMCIAYKNASATKITCFIERWFKPPQKLFPCTKNWDRKKMIYNHQCRVCCDRKGKKVLLMVKTFLNVSFSSVFPVIHHWGWG